MGNLDGETMGAVGTKFTPGGLGRTAEISLWALLPVLC